MLHGRCGPSTLLALNAGISPSWMGHEESQSGKAAFGRASEGVRRALSADHFPFPRVFFSSFDFPLTSFFVFRLCASNIAFPLQHQRVIVQRHIAIPETVGLVCKLQESVHAMYLSATNASENTRYRNALHFSCTLLVTKLRTTYGIQSFFSLAVPSYDVGQRSL